MTFIKEFDILKRFLTLTLILIFKEIWIQLSYAHRINTVGDTAAEEAYNVESPFPYLHFHATEIASITADCDLTNVHNGNDCGKYTVGAHHKGDGPYGG